MKKVFKTQEVAHIWASQQQNEGRNPGNNVFFVNRTIYSYGHHFPMAHIWDKDNNVVFVNSASYSNTTSGHQSSVGSAISHKEKIYIPECILNGKGYTDQHEKNIKYFLAEIEKNVGLQNRARKYSYMGNLNSLLQTFQRYSELFAIRSLLTKEEKEILDFDNADKLFKDCNFTVLRDKKQKQLTRKQNKRNQDNLNTWAGCKLPYKVNKVYLRYNKEHESIETSQHANVPVKAAKILYLRIQAGKDVKGFKIGYYTVISVNGTLKIGCHNIERSEIERLAKIMNW